MRVLLLKVEFVALAALHVFFVLSFAGLAHASSPATAGWTIGQEREVDEGFYFKLLKAQEGWRLWRIETKEEVECRAVKSARGRPHPVPAGAGGMFSGGEPFIVLYWSSYRKAMQHFWVGPNFDNVRVEFRRPGEKFWDVESEGTVYPDGTNLEVNIISWKYPAIHVGYDETRGSFDLSGLDAITDDIKACYQAKE